MRSRIRLTALTALLAAHGAVSAQQNVRTFPEYQCRYTLPADDWSWVKPRPGVTAICAARNRDGLVLALTVLPAPAGHVVDAKFAIDMDGWAASKELTKRDGRITTFRELPCYQLEAMLNGRTTVFRVVIANGFHYQLELAGNADPVEKHPDFETIMNGFEFTSPPVPPSPVDPHQKGKAVAFSVGKITTYGLLGALVLGIVIQCIRRKFW
jgi:hypothetical protein